MKLADELANFIAEKKPNAIHFHNSYFIIPNAVYFLNRRMDIKAIPSLYFWVHSPVMKIILPSGKESVLYDALTSFQNFFKEIFAVSNSVHTSLLNYGINSKVKYLGIDSDFYIKQEENRIITREKLGISPIAFVIIYSGRIIWEKGLDLLPEIYHELVKKDESLKITQFIIAGEGNYTTELQRKLAEEGILHKFHFTIAYSPLELRDLYSAADCFILPSRREALGLSLLEAMSCSLPSIVSDLPSMREVINHPQNGIIISNEKVVEYVRWIYTLFINKTLRKSIALNARDTIVNKFDNKSHYKYFVFRLMK